MHDIHTTLLRTFLTLAETRSFSRTGDRIGRSQSAVSGQIRRLEEALATPLLVRDTRNAALTAEGLCCTNPVMDSSCESSVVFVLHEQTHTPRLQDQELARL